MTGPWSGTGGGQAPLPSQELEHLGRHVRSVIHDINNLLTVIQSQVQLLQTEVSPVASPRFRSIEETIFHTAELTTLLLEYSRQRTTQREQISLNGVVRRVHGLMAPSMAPAVRVELALDPDLPPVKGHPVELARVLHNLWMNARMALAGAGRLVIETRETALSEADVQAQPHRQPGRFVCLHIQDSGPGIPEHLLPLVFEPFGLSRGGGRGHGLGLAIVAQIVRDHEGWVECSSGPGEGTSFRVFLPVACQGSGYGGADAGRGLGKVILLVEPSEGVQRISRLILQQRGFSILVAENPEHAVDTMRALAQPVDLVVIDQAGPARHFEELVQGLRAAGKSARLLVTSALTRHPPASLKLHLNAFLPKPFSPDQLLEAVDQALRDDADESV